MRRKTDKKLYMFKMFTGNSTCMWICDEQSVELKKAFCKEHNFSYDVQECSDPWLTRIEST